MSCCLLQGGDDDVDALLAQFALEEKAKNSADIREDVAPPSARVYASFTAHPTSVRLTPLLLLMSVASAASHLTWLSCQCTVTKSSQRQPHDDGNISWPVN